MWSARFASVFAALASSASGTEQPQNPDWASEMFVAMGAELHTKPNRDNMVMRVEAYCHEIKRVTPRNSPSEEVWLDGELKDGFKLNSDNSRFIRATQSPESARRRFAVFSEGCLNAAGLYKSGKETIALAALTVEFSRFEEPEVIGRRAGLDEDKFMMWMFRTFTEKLALATFHSAVDREQ